MKRTGYAGSLILIYLFVSAPVFGFDPDRPRWSMQISHGVGHGESAVKSPKWRGYEYIIYNHFGEIAIPVLESFRETPKITSKRATLMFERRRRTLGFRFGISAASYFYYDHYVEKQSLFMAEAMSSSLLLYMMDCTELCRGQDQFSTVQLDLAVVKHFRPNHIFDPYFVLGAGFGKRLNYYQKSSSGSVHANLGFRINMGHVYLFMEPGLEASAHWTAYSKDYKFAEGYSNFGIGIAF